MNNQLTMAPSPQHGSHIPPEIYRPLLQVAKLGYDADDVRRWYIDILDHVFHTDNVANDCLHPPDTPLSHNTSLAHDPESVLSTSGAISSAESTTDAQPFLETTTPNINQWSASFPLESFKPTSLPYSTAADSDSICCSVLESQADGNTYWSPGAVTLSGESHIGLPPTTTQPTPTIESTATSLVWPNFDAFNNSLENSRKRRASHSPSYETTMSSAPTPLLMPTMNSTPQSHEMPYVPGTEVTYMYFPPISVIPSRKRQKASSSKRIKKFIQPMHVSRQSV